MCRLADRIVKIKRMLLDTYRNFKMYYNNVLKVRSSFGVSFIKRLKMNLKGFTADQYVRYDFKNNDISDYISELERWQSRKINGRYNLVADDKLIFTEIFGEYVKVPKNFAWVKNKKIYNLDGGIYLEEDFIKLLYREKNLIAKPVHSGGGGRGVYLIREEKERLYLNEVEITKRELFDELKNSDDYMITEYVD